MPRKYFKKAKRIFRQNTFIQTQRGLLPFLLSRSDQRRSFSITIDEQASVSVAAPYFASQQEIFGFIRQKQRWIFLKIEEAKRNQELINNRCFHSGQEFLFLGRGFRINVKEDNIKRPQVDFNGYAWEVKVPDGLQDEQREEAVKSKMVQWYRQQAQEILPQRIFYYSRLMNVEPKNINVRSFKRLWGNCDYRKQSVQFNWQIILSPVNVIDYVVVHELCHLVHPNHSKRFWKKVEKYMPDFREHRQWLRRHATHITLP
ncbi:MAG TPA: SprT family zinc-dependent metalloprotease [Candidatus Omnitrophota bacterium]|nr:SprT family zinc-dependent metalloprotease [Candidatus Omnitrophota bacterium]